MFCPELQKLLKPIYDLTGKDRKFMWVKEWQIVFKEMKHRLLKPLVLLLPKSTGTYTNPTVQVDFTYIWTQVNLLQEGHYTKYKIEIQN